MKNFIKDNMKLIIIILSILILLLIIIGLVLISKSSKNEEGFNDYEISNEVVELPGTKVVKNDTLKEEHCIDKICVSDVVIYKTDKDGRVECNITNKNENTESGYLRLKFNEIHLIVAYKNVLSNSSSKAVAQYTNMDIKDIGNYSVEKLTKKEIKSLIKSK